MPPSLHPFLEVPHCAAEAFAVFSLSSLLEYGHLLEMSLRPFPYSSEG